MPRSEETALVGLGEGGRRPVRHHAPPAQADDPVGVFYRKLDLMEADQQSDHAIARKIRRMGEHRSRHR
jgi:hypothetical protein